MSSTIWPADVQKQWLIEHIPHRLRACAYGLALPIPWLQTQIHVVHSEQIALHCLQSSLWEGRFTAMRWLIMFVGISERKGTAVRYKISRPTDVVIEQFDGGTPIPLNTAEAEALAKIWLGCSQATSHPTQGTNHPDIGADALANAFQIVVTHLQNTIYDHAGMDVAKVTLLI